MKAIKDEPTVTLGLRYIRPRVSGEVQGLIREPVPPDEPASLTQGAQVGFKQIAIFRSLFAPSS